MIALGIALFALTVWLGAYLVAFAGRSPTMRLTGLGLLAYAVALAARLLAASAAPPLAIGLLRASVAIGVLAPALWMGAAAHLVPHEAAARGPLVATWRYLVLPLAAFDAGLAIGTPWIIDPVDGAPGPAFWIHVAAVGLMAFDALVALAVARRGLGPPYGWVLLAVGILFGLGVTSAALPHAAFGRPLWSVAVAFDLVLLGVAVAAYDAFETGERLGPHMLRSALAALGPAAFVGLQLALFGALAGPSTALVALSLAVLGSLVVVQTAGGAIGRRLGAWLPGDPALRRERAELAATAERLERRAVGRAGGRMGGAGRRTGAGAIGERPGGAARGDAGPAGAPRLDRPDFDRAVRRALSDLRDLPRLATSPLLETGVVPAGGTSLDRARALRARLVAAVGSLRPAGADGFSPEPPHRHFNALHYPYVVGLRPYARTAIAGTVGAKDLDADAAKALAWLRHDVPERTLYNWQTAGSRLIAAALWEELEAI